MTEFFIAMIVTAAVNYAALSRPDGFLAIRKQDSIRAAISLGGCVIMIALISCFIAAILNLCVLAPLGLLDIAGMIFIPAILGAVWLAEKFFKNNLPELYSKTAPFWILSGLNCAVIYAVLSINNNNFASGIGFGLLAAIAFAVINILFAAIMNKIDEADLPESVRGAPVILLSAGLIAIALAGLSGLSF